MGSVQAVPLNLHVCAQKALGFCYTFFSNNRGDENLLK